MAILRVKIAASSPTYIKDYFWESFREQQVVWFHRDNIVPWSLSSLKRHAPGKPFHVFYFSLVGSWLSLSRMDKLNGALLCHKLVSGDQGQWLFDTFSHIKWVLYFISQLPVTSQQNTSRPAATRSLFPAPNSIGQPCDGFSVRE